MEIIIIDDSLEKAESLEKWIKVCLPASKIEISDCAHDGFGKVVKGCYDLVLLDVMVPYTSKGTPTEEAALWFVTEVHRKLSRAAIPMIIGATQYPDAMKKVEESFGKVLWSIIVIEELTGRWRQELKIVLDLLGSNMIGVSPFAAGKTRLACREPPGHRRLRRS